MLRKIIFAIASIACCASAASAADLPQMPAPRYSQPSYVTPAQNWTGAYVGIHAGYSKGSEDLNPSMGFDLKPKGWLFGGQIGYDRQLTNYVVVGAVADFSWTGQKDKASKSYSYYDYDDCLVDVQNTHEAKLNWFGTLRGRFGLVPWERVMLYATGGLAYGSASHTFSTKSSTKWDSWGYSQADTRYGVGYALGGGAEFKLTNNVSLFGEYLHLHLNLGESKFSGGGKFSSAATDNIVRAGLNWRF